MDFQSFKVERNFDIYIYVFIIYRMPQTVCRILGPYYAMSETEYQSYHRMVLN